MPPSLSEQMETLTKNRERYFQRVQLCFDLTKVPDKTAEFLQRCKQLDETFAKFEGICDQLNLLNSKVDEGDQVDTLKTTKSFEEIFFRAKAHEALIMSELKASSSGSTTSETQAHTPKVNLPVINIPNFTGNIADFPSWKSLYDELVHKSSHLSNIQKFSYLRSYLKGSALQCVETISFSEENYPLAYKSLLDRYAKKRTLASTLMNKLLEFKPLASDSVEGLRAFLDGFHVVVESIKSLCISNLDEFILVHLALKVLDSKTALEFEKEMASKEFPSFTDLVHFVLAKSNILEQTAESSCTIGSTSVKPRFQRVETKSRVLVGTVSSPDNQSKTRYNKVSNTKCHLCASGPHKLSLCPKFLKSDTSKRYTIVKELKLCFSCLSSSHLTSDCTSVYRCRTCGSSRHHSMLHNRSSNVSSEVNQISTDPNAQGPSNLVISGVAQSVKCSTVVLSTASMQIQDAVGNWIPARGVVDPGSQVSIISERLAQTLGLPRKYCSLQIAGIGASSAMKTKGQIQCKVLPTKQNSRMNCNQSPICVNAVIMPKITANLSSNLSSVVLQRFQHLNLADLTYYSQSSENTQVDVLLGAEYYQDIILNNSPIFKGSPCAVPSIFGYLLIGRVDDQHSTSNQTHTSLFISSIEEDHVSTQLQKFWELEEVGSTNVPIVNQSDQYCEDHFVQTHTREKSGRYIVRLPFHNDSPSLGSNRDRATQLFYSMEKRLNKNDHIKKLYCENLQTYLDMGHMEQAKVPSNYLLSHHGVYRENSSTTKLRVVFNPNLVSNSGQTLSKILHVGPKLQLDIQDLLVNFRLHPIAITCDIQSMYRCILVAPEDRSVQHILWRPDSSSEVQEYELKTVTFGLPPSPFLAQRVLKQLAEDERDKFPEASQTLLDSTYVDDVCSGSVTVESTKYLRDQLISLLHAGGFHLRKWNSSNPDVLKDLPQEMCDKPHTLGSDDSTKVLGLQWSSGSDCFSYSVSIEHSSPTTKRQVLSVLASIYDVNGFLSPVIVLMKIFLQQLWLNKEDTWDSPVPSHLQSQWSKFITELPLLSNLQIPRYILGPGDANFQLIGFADASFNAYAAVVYLRVSHSSGVQINLVRAKTKVSPLKVQTINRLELCAALLLAKVINSLSFLIKKLNIKNVYLFSDSKTVLAWLQTQPYLLKTYVANRVVQILEWTDPSQWHHIASENNSADPASRGLTPVQFLDNQLWFHGPKFLLVEPNEWPLSKVREPGENLPELKPSNVCLAIPQETKSNDFIDLFKKYSSINKLQRVVAYTLRFINNARFPDNQSKDNTLSVKEMQTSLHVCLKLSQSVYFSHEIKLVQKGDSSSPALRSLSPMMLGGLLVVGGRLENASIPDHSKHPILLSKHCPLTLLIIRNYHLMTIHGGAKLVQSLLQQRYWIINARNLIRSIISKCVACTKHKAKTLQPIMANLPKSRVTQGRPFINVGVDFAGPFSYKTGPRRNSPLDKCYLAVFVCMATKCVHLEIVSSLSTPAFIATLDRFVSRRGLPDVIYSDNGTNFRGAASYMNEVQTFLRDSSKTVSSHLLPHEVTWSFIAPSSPNFGGLWEAAVKSAKCHMKHVLQGHALNFEEFSTVTTRIEAILNSRPLCVLSSDPNDRLEALTPGHFLTGAPLLARPEHEMSEENILPSKRWRLITQVTQSFWKLWTRDYLNTLIQRSKWTKSTDNIKEGDVVLIQGQTPSVQNWPLGIVSKLMPGSDGIVRVVTVRTTHGELMRPVNKLVVLPVSD